MNKYSDRFLLLDIMRAFAVFMMIQGHTIDALLSPANFNDANPFFHVWQFGRGLTAPIFLFGSGFAYVIANTRKSVDGRLPLSMVFRRLRWIVVLFLIGALMHFPVPTISQIADAGPDKWHGFFRVDVLRLMAVTLLGLLALFIVARNQRQVFIGTFAITALIVAVTPIVYSFRWSPYLHQGFVGYLSMESGSYFPIFPFSGYLFAGAAAAVLYLRWKANGTDPLLVPRFFLAGASAIVVTVGWQNLVIGQGFDPASPLYFLLRLGTVLVLWAAIGSIVRRVRTMPRIIPILGQHTLLIYVSHVIALYGCAWFLGMSAFVGKSLPIVPVSGVILGLIVSTTLLALWVHDIRTERRLAYRLAPYAAMVLLTLIFSDLIKIY